MPKSHHIFLFPSIPIHASSPIHTLIHAQYHASLHLHHAPRPMSNVPQASHHLSYIISPANANDACIRAYSTFASIFTWQVWVVCTYSVCTPLLFTSLHDLQGRSATGDTQQTVREMPIHHHRMAHHIQRTKSRWYTIACSLSILQWIKNRQASSPSAIGWGWLVGRLREIGNVDARDIRVYSCREMSHDQLNSWTLKHRDTTRSQQTVHWDKLRGRMSTKWTQDQRRKILVGIARLPQTDRPGQEAEAKQVANAKKYPRKKYDSVVAVAFHGT